MSFIRRKLISPLIFLLKQGLTPEKLAFSVALGIVLGVFPVLGSTTILCAIAGLILGLNQPAIQTVNYFTYPLQLALFIPFIRMGEFLFRVKPIPFSLAQIISMLHSDMWGTIKRFWTTSVHAMAAWLIVAPVAAAIIYYILVPIFRRLAPKKKGAQYYDQSTTSASSKI